MYALNLHLYFICKVLNGFSRDSTSSWHMTRARTSVNRHVKISSIQAVDSAAKHHGRQPT